MRVFNRQLRNCSSWCGKLCQKCGITGYEGIDNPYLVFFSQFTRASLLASRAASITLSFVIIKELRAGKMAPVRALVR